MIRRFLTTAVPTIRTKAVTFIGQSLQGREESEVPQDVIQRFMDLWDWYWNEVGREDVKGDQTSRMFGYWFISGIFPVGICSRTVPGVSKVV